MAAGLAELFTERRSRRAFSPRPIDREVLLSLFEAPRWAPSSRNTQPWEFIVGARDTHPETHKRITESLNPLNGKYAPRAPVLAVALATTKEEDGTPLEHGWHDSGIALGFLILQARALGLEVHPMAGFDAELLRQAFSIPADRDPTVVVALGYAGEPADLPDGMGDRDTAERSRKPLSEVMLELDPG